MVDISRVRNADGTWGVTWKFEDESFETLKTIAEEHRFNQDAIVFREGDSPDGMYLILEGSANIIRKTGDGSDRIVAVVTKGQSFGEIGVLVEQPRRASVVAATPLHVLKVSPYALDVMQRSAPDMAFLMYRALARTLAEQLLNTQEMKPPQ